MKCVLSELQEKHYPKSYLINGIRESNPESPDRIAMLLEGALAAGLDQVAPPSYGRQPILQVHPERYLTFLENVAERWSRINLGTTWFFLAMAVLALLVGQVEPHQSGTTSSSTYSPWSYSLGLHWRLR